LVNLLLSREKENRKNQFENDGKIANVFSKAPGKFTFGFIITAIGVLKVIH